METIIYERSMRTTHPERFAGMTYAQRLWLVRDLVNRKQNALQEDLWGEEKDEDLDSQYSQEGLLDGIGLCRGICADEEMTHYSVGESQGRRVLVQVETEESERDFDSLNDESAYDDEGTIMSSNISRYTMPGPGMRNTTPCSEASENDHTVGTDEAYDMSSQISIVPAIAYVSNGVDLPIDHCYEGHPTGGSGSARIARGKEEGHNVNFDSSVDQEDENLEANCPNDHNEHGGNTWSVGAYIDDNATLSTSAFSLCPRPTLVSDAADISARRAKIIFLDRSKQRDRVRPESETSSTFKENNCADSHTHFLPKQRPGESKSKHVTPGTGTAIKHGYDNSQAEEFKTDGVSHSAVPYATDARRGCKIDAGLSFPFVKKDRYVLYNDAKGSSPEFGSGATPDKSGKPVSNDRNGKIIEPKNKSRPVHFRDPFPAVRAPFVTNDADDIIDDHCSRMNYQPPRMLRPSIELQQLFLVIKEGPPHRRSNACGTLKLMTMSKQNQLVLVQTKGFLKAITEAASREIAPCTDRHVAVEARTRALACILNVCKPRSNRLHITNHKGTTECLLKVIQDDSGECRVLACTALVLLARSPECRQLLLGVKTLIDVLAAAMGCNAIELLTEVHCETYYRESWKRKSGMGDSACDDDVFTAIEMKTVEHDEKAKNANLEYVSSTSSSGLEPPSAVAKKTEISKIDQKLHSTSQRAVLISCAVLLHLSKDCAFGVSVAAFLSENVKRSLTYSILSQSRMCANREFMSILIATVKDPKSIIQSKCLEIACNLSRFSPNRKLMVQHEALVDALTDAAFSVSPTNRLNSLRTLQNISADASGKLALAKSTFLSSMVSCALRRGTGEKESAVAVVYNLSTEPGTVVAMVRTKNLVALMVHLTSHSETPSPVRLMACETLACLSLWLQTLAGIVKVTESCENKALPTLTPIATDMWD